MESRVRFQCHCGKRLSAAVSSAGKQGHCPRCKAKLTVPKPKPTRKEAALQTESARAPAERCRHPKLQSLYEAVLERFPEDVRRHGIEAGCPVLKFVIPEDREQAIRLAVETDAKSHEWLIVSSEIGTVMTFDETATALRLNRTIPSGRLVLDDRQVLMLEHRERLDEVDEQGIIGTVQAVGRWADEFESQLFGLDVR